MSGQRTRCDGHMSPLGWPIERMSLHATGVVGEPRVDVPPPSGVILPEDPRYLRGLAALAPSLRINLSF